jgi:DeoR/GlpR family transcriptional regulator of sugar metabolism
MIKDLNSTLVRRHEELLQLVDTQGKISVDELARYLGVSDDTIRRDLQNLEQRKLLLRTHGGAICIVVADASKFGVNAFAQIASLDTIDVLVSDVCPPPDLRQALDKANVELIVTPY